MSTKGHKYTAEQRANLSRGHLGQVAWNAGTGGCKVGHDPALYVCPPSGVYVCLGCKRVNGARYRAANKEVILFKSRIARYGLPLDAFEALWNTQGGMCAICKTSFGEQAYRIDHDHGTGEVRGILCVPCNTGLGLMKDSRTVLLNAMTYLDAPPAQGVQETCSPRLASPPIPQSLTRNQQLSFSEDQP